MVSDLTVPVRARRARVDAARAVSGLGTHLEGRTAATSPAESARRLIALLTPRGFFASLRSMLDGFLVAELLLRTAAVASEGRALGRLTGIGWGNRLRTLLADSTP
ncbi:MAG: hypothetical protein ACRDQA_31070, partial [Nocardioidaceae bacterium]